MAENVVPFMLDPDAEDWTPEAPEFSEIALAESFAEKHEDRLRYTSTWSRWHRWTGDRWADEDTLEVFDLARKIAREAAARADNEGLRRKVAAASTVAAIERLARSDRRLAARIEQWDSDPWALNTPAGVVDLRTGRIRAQRLSDYHTKTTGVAPGGACPRWLVFLDQVTDGDRDLQAYLQRVAGYALTGSTDEHALFFLFGTGANGKSVFMTALRSIVGDYATASGMETWTESRNDRHPTELARLRGARLVCSSETEEGRAWAISRIKELTGGEMVTARFMRADFFEYAPQFKLVFSGNHKPMLRGAEEAERRRFHMIPFVMTIPPEKRDPLLSERLRAEAGGILSWAIEGCLAWQRNRLSPPERVRGATAAYFEAEDSLTAWIEERVTRRAESWELSAHVFADWKEWAESNGEQPGSQKMLSQRLSARGFEQAKRAGGQRTITGLRLRANEREGA